LNDYFDKEELRTLCADIDVDYDDLGGEGKAAKAYDPVHHVVYSALLLGPHGKAEKRTEAWAWQVATGNRVNLAEQARAREKELEKDSARQALSIHLTRTNPKKLHEFLTKSKLEQLAGASGAIYALNSGSVATANVATGGLGGFVNNITNLWDIAAGEVLVRACGGKVTTFDGSPIKYSVAQQSSVVASHNRFIREYWIFSRSNEHLASMAAPQLSLQSGLLHRTQTKQASGYLTQSRPSRMGESWDFDNKHFLAARCRPCSATARRSVCLTCPKRPAATPFQNKPPHGRCPAINGQGVSF
jgi:hypothetical protein